MNRSHERQKAVWLLLCCALVFAMVVVGGVTRLTRSGLSIVEWRPVTGAVPPLSDAQWQQEFAKYQRSPEYQKVNRGMSLEGFKRIFWVEYFHRLLGRLIGVVFLVPFLYFAIRRRLDRRLLLKLGGLFALGGLQGAMGWVMVASGLVDVPRVSPYRLTAHLGLALVLYAAMLWLALGLLAPPAATEPGRRRLSHWTLGLSGLTLVMGMSGGLVAGHRAGMVFNTFPLMEGRLIPPGLLALEPWWVNFFDNIITVQFDHRMLAYVVSLAVVGVWVAVLRSPVSARARLLAHALLGAVVVQLGLGIATLLLYVPVTLGAAHQGGAVVLFTVALALAHELGHEQAHAQTLGPRLGQDVAIRQGPAASRAQPV